MIEYLAGTLLSLGIVFGSHWLFFRQETHFRWNRFWLLGGTLFSLLLPMLSLPSTTAIRWAQMKLPEVIISPLSHPTANSTLGLNDLLLLVYVSGCIIMLLRLIHQSWQLRNIIQKSADGQEIGGMQKVSTSSVASCSSFFWYLFVPREFDISNSRDRSIFFHERAHQQQGHSFDLLIFQALRCGLWFNPFLYLIEKDLRIVHEFQADVAVIQSGEQKSEYMKILAQQAFPQFENLFTHSFNKSSITKRIKMMNQKRSGKLSILKGMMILPVVLFTLFTFSCNNSNNNSGKISSGRVIAEEVIPDVQPQFPGGEKAMLTHLYSNIKYPQLARDKEVEGLVLVTFTVNTDGTLNNFEAEKDPGKGLGEAAIEAIKTMPAWEPGKKNGKAIKVEYSLPVRFKLEY